ncbi:MAG: T9SS type A sorting domain-containing protein, partial [Ignavibacteriae bacterium]|nr:T9SS type A sorting domain-containing protein [Ignavibacteriota bacterium]
DTLAARCLDSLDGTKKKAMSSQQKSLPPNKQNNKLFAELLTLRLNRQASVYEKFPVGLGQLTFDDPNNVGHPFNGMMVDEISLIADSMLSCLEISLDVTPNELYEIIRMLNCAFADSTIDTLSFGSKTKLTGVKSLFEVDYLQPTPGIAPRIVQSFDVTESIIPERFELSQNYPNPFNPSTQLSFVIGQSSLVSLKVFNMLGQEVATLLKKEEMEEGEYELPFNAVSAAGGLPSGVYFYRINVESVDEDGIIHYFSDSKRMMFIK